MHSHPGLNISIGELSIGSRSPALTIFMFVVCRGLQQSRVMHSESSKTRKSSSSPSFMTE